MNRAQKNRLDTGGRIDRNQPLKFQFNGKDLEGFQGDTLASALLANGISTVNRSFKYHRPRGVMSAGVEETNALLTVSDGDGELPVVRATLRALQGGHRIHSPGGFPSVNFDLGRALDFTHRLWPAGFYNKIFKWPNWHFYERAVRGMAGLGELPGGEDPYRYFHHNLHCDVLIVGAGPAGLAAALSAAASGARVLLVEQDHELFINLAHTTYKLGLQTGPKFRRWLDLVVSYLQHFTDRVGTGTDGDWFPINLYVDDDDAGVLGFFAGRHAQF